MEILRKILLPFSLLYWLITLSRNFLYNVGVLKSFSFPLPVIAIGNLSTGGTGKSPQTEYLIRLLSGKYHLATLSRGYKRKSKGFVLGSENSNASELGDEPYQFYRKFPKVRVAVDADRVNGVTNLLNLTPKPQAIVLDDAYQHRRLKAGFYILLTAYEDLYVDDFLLPAGNLREGGAGAGRADIIIVTKCPINLSALEQQNISKKLQPLPGQKVYFTAIEYDNEIYSEQSRIDVMEAKHLRKVVAAGIAKPKPFFYSIANETDELLTYPDHHDFSEEDIADMLKKAGDSIIVTTEKDYVRLQGRLPKDKLFYLPIKSRFLNSGEEFDKIITDYVGQSTGNR